MMTQTPPEFFGPRKWDAADREEVREHHRELWADLKRDWGHGSGDSLEWMPGLRESIESLMDQDYSFEDISVFFGLSRERMCQLAEKFGFHVRGPQNWSARRATTHRVFDWDSLRFVSVDKAALMQAEVERRRDAKRAERRSRPELVREEILRFADRNGRPPTRVELAELLFPESKNPTVMLVDWLMRSVPPGPAHKQVGVKILDRIYASCSMIRPNGASLRAQRPELRRRRALAATSGGEG